MNIKIGAFVRWLLGVVVITAVTFNVIGCEKKPTKTYQRKESSYAGEVFGKPVTLQEYNQFYRATQLFMPSDKPLKDPKLLRNYTWQNIIYAQEAKSEGITITDEEVRNEIANILKQQGLISPTAEQYKAWLTRTLHLSPREFEEGLREFIRIQKLLRMKMASFAPVGANQKTAFMTWTNDINKRAAFKDYSKSSSAKHEEASNTTTQNLNGQHFTKLHYLFGDFVDGQANPVNAGIMMGDSPEKDSLYCLAGMEVMQKTKGGFLIKVRADLNNGFLRQNIIFLYTDWDLGYGSPLDAVYAYYVGDYEYKNLTGFNQQVYAFRVFDYRDTNNEEHKRIIAKLNRDYHAPQKDEPNFIAVDGKVVPNPQKQKLSS